MKVQKFCFFVLLLFPILGNAQESGIATYCISYGYTHLTDCNATLIFKGKESFFVTSAGPNNTFAFQAHDTLCCPPHRMITSAGNESQVYTNFSKGEMIADNQLLIPSRYTLEKPNTIKWAIHNDSKKVADYDCQKATCTFRGREYTAWFAKDIPVNFGPWKFNGLPGLVMEVLEKNGHIHILLSALEQNATQKLPKLSSKKYLTVPEYLNQFKKEVLKMQLENFEKNGVKIKPSMKLSIDIGSFTELETGE